MSASARVAVLLGAGASADAGLPVTLTMTDEIIDRTYRVEHQRLLQYIRHRLAADAALPRVRLGRPGDQRHSIAVDVERLFAAVDLLIERGDQPWSPFVAAWDSGLESFGVSEIHFPSQGRASELLSALDERYHPERRRPHMGSRIEGAFESAVQDAINRSRPNVTKLLVDVRTEMLENLRALLTVSDSSRVDYLRPLAELADGQKSLTLATLNYDLAIELAASRAGVGCDTGIGTWLVDGRLDWRGEGIKLIKLHGSIDWLSAEAWSTGGLPHVRFTTVEGDHARGEPGVIFGEGSKLRSEGPFLELLLAWAADLNEANNLLVVGYSFRDPHVNETIARWFNADPTRAIVLVSPDDVDELSRNNEFMWALRRTNPVTPGSGEPEPTRFRHVSGRAQDVLREAIDDARRLLSAV